MVVHRPAVGAMIEGEISRSDTSEPTSQLADGVPDDSSATISLEELQVLWQIAAEISPAITCRNKTRTAGGDLEPSIVARRPSGSAGLRLRRQGRRAGDGQELGGRPAGRQRQHWPRRKALDETLGAESGAPANEAYADRMPFAFSGRLDEMTVICDSLPR